MPSKILIILTNISYKMLTKVPINLYSPFNKPTKITFRVKNKIFCIMHKKSKIQNL